MAQYPFTENVIPALLAWRRAGHAGALVTLAGADGTSPRPIGSQMAVNADGEYTGMISSGCAEAAIVAEAVAAIAARVPRTVRYGRGSPYLDVVLPCGSGIDVHFDPCVPIAVLAELTTDIAARRPASLTIDPGGLGLVRSYPPTTRILIAGRGPQVDLVAQYATLLEWDIAVVSPDEATLKRNALLASTTRHLKSPADFDASGLVDAATAVVLLFHDHDWEPPILAACEASPAFYIGALGSRAAHAQRLQLLRERGCSEAFIGRIRAPVGLAIGGKSPPEIALAIAAEILSCVRGPVTPIAAVERRLLLPQSK